MEKRKVSFFREGRKRPTIGIFIGNYHSFHPSRLVDRIYEDLKEYDVDAHFYLGTESSSFIKDPHIRDNRFDYQYSFLYSMSNVEDLDAMIIGVGTIGIFQNLRTKADFLSCLPDVPTVYMETPEFDDRNCVVADNYDGFYSMVEHLIKVHGRKNILLITGPDYNWDSRERLRAYKDCLQNHGIVYDEKRVAHGDFSENVDDLVLQCLERNPDADAFMSANDEMAYAVYRVCSRKNISIGKDFSVTGFDDMEFARYLEPALTTVQQRNYLMADAAVKKVISLLEGKSAPQAKLPVNFIVRASCGCEYGEEARAKDIPIEMSPSLKGVDGNEYERNALLDTIRRIRTSEQHSWIGALIARDLVANADDPKYFYKNLGEALAYQKTKESYLAVYKKGVEFAPGDMPEKPANMILIMHQKGDRVDAYDMNDAPVINSGDSVPWYDEDGEGHEYMTFLLFCGKRVYGFLSVEIEPKDISYYYMLSLEIGTAIHSLELTQRQKKYRKELQKKNEILDFSASHDALTSVYNRLGFEKKADEYVKKHPDSVFTLVTADLDHLKEINDNFGHAEGDFAILKASEILIKAMGEGAVIGRTGGDEFYGLVTTDNGDTGEAVYIRIKDLCERFNTFSAKSYNIELSVGCGEVSYKDMKERRESVQIEVDAKLYEDKKNRRASIIKD